MLGKAAFFVCLLHAHAAVAAAVQINFDLEAPAGVAAGRGSGLLHSLSGTEPPDRFVDPLKLKFWRGSCFLDDALYQRLQRSDAVIQYVLSDGFQHPTQGTCAEQQNTDRWPHQDPALWQTFVESEAHRIAARGYKVVWEPWNEPDYWPASADAQTDNEKFQQYLVAFRQAYQAVKRVDPAAQFAGPSLSAGHWPTARRQLETFLEFCARNNIEVAHLTWHGFDDVENTDKWPERIHAMRDLAARKYPTVKVQQIVISEIVAKRYFYSPGDLVVTLKYLDDAGADFVGRTCHSFESCWLPTMDGAVAKGEDNQFHPTPIWWANLWYASALGQRYSGVSSNKGVTAVAVRRDGKIGVLLGFSKALGPGHAQTIVLVLDRLHGVTSADVRVERAPEQEDGFLAAPIKVTDFTVDSTPQRAIVELPVVQPGDAYFISLAPK